MAPNAALSRTTVDEVGVTTELGGDALSSCSGGRNSGGTACNPTSEPSAEICGVAAGIAPNANLSITIVDEAGDPTGLGSGVLPSCSGVGNSEETACRPRSETSTEIGRGVAGLLTRKQRRIAGTCVYRKTQLTPREAT